MIDTQVGGPEVEQLRHAFAHLRVVAAHSREGEVQEDTRSLEMRIMTMLGRLDPAKSPETPGRLTPREIDVVALVAIGWKNAEIADELKLGTETVKSYLRDAMDKLGAHRRQDVVEAARLAGYIP